MRHFVYAILTAGLLVVGGAAPFFQSATIHFVVSEFGTAVHNDSYVLPISDPTHIRQARDLIRYGAGAGPRICVATIAHGSDGINRNVIAPGEPLWNNWHVVGFSGFAELTAEVLDGWPGLVEQSPGAYIHEGSETGQIGFWGYTVTAELGSGPPGNPPATPGGFSVGAAGSTVTVAWTDASTNEEGFEVARETKIGNTWRNPTLITVGPNVSSVTDSPGVGTHRYRVRSYRISGSSTWTAWKSIRIR